MAGGSGKKSNAQAGCHAKDRWFFIAKVILTIAPFIALGYLQLFTGGGDLSKVLQNNPDVTLIFLVSMAGPFTAYLLGFAQNHFYEGETEYLMAHLVLMLIAEIMLRNVVYIVIMVWLLCMVYQMTGMTPFDALRKKWKNHFFRDLSGCFVLLVFSAFCLFVSLRLQ